MSVATVTIRDMDKPTGAKRIIMECPHGTTTAVFVEGGEFTQEEVISAMAERHEAREKCRCPRRLARDHASLQ